LFVVTSLSRDIWCTTSTLGGAESPAAEEEKKSTLELGDGKKGELEGGPFDYTRRRGPMKKRKRTLVLVAGVVFALSVCGQAHLNG